MHLEVRQQGIHSDVWEAEIQGYSYQALPKGSHENVSLWINVTDDLEVDEWRLFTVTLYINGSYVGGLSVKVTAQPGWVLCENVFVCIILGTCVVLTLVVLIIRRRRT